MNPVHTNRSYLFQCCLPVSAMFSRQVNFPNDLQPKFCMHICLLKLSSTPSLTSIIVSLRVHIMLLFTKQLACTVTNKVKRNHKKRPDRDKLCFILHQGDEVPKQSSFQISIFSNLSVLGGGELNLKLSNLAFCCMC